MVSSANPKSGPPRSPTASERHSGSWRPSWHPALVAAALAYLGLRALVLHTNFDQVALPAYELHPPGTLARNLLGPSGELPLLYCYDNSLGQLLVSFLVWPSFEFFGPSYLAYKLVAFVTMFPCLLLIWSFLERHFGTRAAILGAALYALPPTTLFQYSLLPAGNHAENVPFAMLAAWAFLRVHGSARPRLGVFLAGLSGGLALTISFAALVPVALLFALHAGLVGLRRSARELPLALAGLALGVAPLYVANTLAGGARGLSFLQAKFQGSTSGGIDWSLIGERLGLFFGEYLPRSAAAHDFLGLSGDVADFLFLGAFLAAALLSLPYALRGLAEIARGLFGAGALARGDGGALGRAILVLLYAYLPLTGLAFALSDLRMGDHAWPFEAAGYRYFLPHFLFAILLIALTAARLWSRGGPARAVGAALAAVALVSGTFDLALIDLASEQKGVGAHYEGHNVKQTARTLFRPENQLRPDDDAVDYATIVRIAESYPPPWREQIYFGLGFYEPYRILLHAFPPDLEPSAVLAPYPPERHADLARGIGTLMRHRETAPAELPDAVWQALERYAANAEPLAERVAEGLATRWSPLLASGTAAFLDEDLLLLERLRARVPALSAATARGFGLAAGRLARREIPLEERLIEAAFARLAPPDVEPFLLGSAWASPTAANGPGSPSASPPGWHPSRPTSCSRVSPHDSARSTARASRPAVAHRAPPRGMGGSLARGNPRLLTGPSRRLQRAACREAGNELQG